MSIDRRSVLAAILLAAGAGLVGVDVVTGPDRPGRSPLGGTPSGPTGPDPTASRPGTDGRGAGGTSTADAVAEPAWIALPSIATRSWLLRLGVAEDGAMEVPSMAEAARAGWYEHSPRPGATGPAVIVGHVDSTTGPAVFHRLSELVPGDRVEVGRADGSTARFRVTRVARYPKDHFPTRTVYGDTSAAELRLITCGGGYAPGRGYLDNVVVFATATT